MVGASAKSLFSDLIMNISYPTHLYTGLLKSFTVWTTALSSQEVRSLFNERSFFDPKINYDDYKSSSSVGINLNFANITSSNYVTNSASNKLDELPFAYINGSSVIHDVEDFELGNNELSLNTSSSTLVDISDDSTIYRSSGHWKHGATHLFRAFDNSEVTFFHSDVKNGSITHFGYGKDFEPSWIEQDFGIDRAVGKVEFIKRPTWSSRNNFYNVIITNSDGVEVYNHLSRAGNYLPSSFLGGSSWNNSVSINFLTLLENYVIGSKVRLIRYYRNPTDHLDEYVSVGGERCLNISEFDTYGLPLEFPSSLVAYVSTLTERPILNSTGAFPGFKVRIYDGIDCDEENFIQQSNFDSESTELEINKEFSVGEEHFVSAKFLSIYGFVSSCVNSNAFEMPAF